MRQLMAEHSEKNVARKAVLTACVISIFLLGCEAERLGARETGALTGGALGAGLGAIVGNQFGSPGAGIAIGAGFGALTGGLIGNEVQGQEAVLSERDERLRAQEAQLEENRRLIAALRGKGADVRSTDRGVVVNLPDVLFEFNSARLTRDSIRTIREIGEIAGTVGDRRISVEGHTDSIGSIAYNKRLSIDRASSVADQLVSDGVSSRNLMVKGLGESTPVASNESAAGRARNRRVEVIIENR